VRRAAGNARRLQGLARDVLDSESLAAGRMAFAFGEVDLVAEVREAAEVAGDLLADRTIDVAVPAGPVSVHGDADRIQQVLTNLLDNAAQNSPAGEPIRLRLAVEGAEAVLTVTDLGPGLPAEVAERVFERFVRGRLDRIGGTGLGLYIVRSIVEAHGGSVAVASAPGEGATFTVRFPVRG
jgi:two-component system OmpR family sensor kinase